MESTMALQHILADMSYMMHQRKSFVHSIMGCVIEPPLLSAAEEKHHQKKEKKIIFHGQYDLGKLIIPFTTKKYPRYCYLLHHFDSFETQNSSPG